MNHSLITTASVDSADSTPIMPGEHPEGLLLVDLESWQINAANGMAVTLLGYKPPELLATTLDELVLCDRPTLQHILQELYDQGRWGPNILTYQDSEHRPINLLTSASLLTYMGDRVISWLLRPAEYSTPLPDAANSLTSEITVLENLNRLKDDFLSSISHELRTPIANIKMATQMLEIALNRLGLLDDHAIQATKLKHYLQILQDESNRETHLISDLLDIQNLEAGNHRLTMQAIQLETYLQRIAHPFYDQAQKRSQQFEVHLAPDLPILQSDAQHLERAIVELLTNACKYTPERESIRLTARSHQPPDSTQSHVLITIHNSGIEIPKSQICLVFDKFYRLPSRDPHQYGGTGLGLALVERIVQRLGGSVWADSSDGATWFTIDLPTQAP